MKRFATLQLIIIGLLFAGVTGISQSAYAKPVWLGQIDHIHGIAVNPSDSTKLLLATHSGPFLATASGIAVPISKFTADMMSLAVDPVNPKKLYASGHPEGGGNLGVMASVDAGRSWKHLSDGAGGPVDFHALTVSPMEPGILYGAYDGLQKSLDGGVNWQVTGRVPENLFSLAASAKNKSTLYAGTMKGLMISRDDGRSWQPGLMIQKPTTMVHVTRQGRIYVFVYGVGLLTAMEPGLSWDNLSKNFQDRALMSFAIDMKNPNKLFGVSDTGTVMTSNDGGKRWTSFQGSDTSTPAKINQGEKLYVANCQQCHGIKGVGERPGEPNAKDEFGFLAPPLNDNGHAWHHPDQQLVETILNGSPRNERMIAWKENLSKENVKAIVSYIKSLWSFRSLACQGARHMACMQ